jgi:hypothetical protein
MLWITNASYLSAWNFIQKIDMVTAALAAEELSRLQATTLLARRIATGPDTGRRTEELTADLEEELHEIDK